MNNHSWQITGHSDIPILVHHYHSLESTNSEARRMAMENASAWTVICADLQTKGRGRYHRKWHSPAGLGLYFSVILRPKIDLKFLNMINMRAALVIREILQIELSQADLQNEYTVQLKWPNDILVNEKKICGILLESEILSSEVKYLILGIGININHQGRDFPVELQETATSLKLLTKQNWETNRFLNKVLPKLQQQIILDQEAGFRNVILEYQKYLAFKNQVVEIKIQNQSIKGCIKGIDPYGYLLLEQGNETRTISTGDIAN